MEVPLTQGKVAQIDDADWPLVSQYNWWAKLLDGKWYAHGKIKGGGWGRSPEISMHRLLMGFPPTKVDHKNDDGLCNRRSNLRVATDAQNQANRTSRYGASRFKGVSWNTEKGRWRASIFREGKHRFLGYFTDEVDAALAYNRAAAETDGEFARLNEVA